MPHDVYACSLRDLKYASCTGLCSQSDRDIEKRRWVCVRQRSRTSTQGTMKSLCLLLGVLGLTLADPTVHFVEKFESGRQELSEL